VERSPHFVFAIAVVVASVFALALAVAAVFAFLVVIPEGDLLLLVPLLSFLPLPFALALSLLLLFPLPLFLGVERGFSPASKPVYSGPPFCRRHERRRSRSDCILPLQLPLFLPLYLLPGNPSLSSHHESIPKKYSLHPDHPNHAFHHNFTTQISQANARTPLKSTPAPQQFFSAKKLASK
jgi:hypothetical protein